MKQVAEEQGARMVMARYRPVLLRRNGPVRKLTGINGGSKLALSERSMMEDVKYIDEREEIVDLDEPLNYPAREERSNRIACY